MRARKIPRREYVQVVEELDMFPAECCSIPIFIALILVPPGKKSGLYKMKEKS